MRTKDEMLYVPCWADRAPLAPLVLTFFQPLAVDRESAFKLCRRRVAPATDERRVSPVDRRTFAHFLGLGADEKRKVNSTNSASPMRSLLPLNDLWNKTCTAA